MGDCLVCISLKQIITHFYPIPKLEKLSSNSTSHLGQRIICGKSLSILDEHNCPVSSLISLSTQSSHRQSLLVQDITSLHPVQ